MSRLYRSMQLLIRTGLQIRRKWLEIVYYVIQNADFRNGYTRREMKTFDVSEILLKTLITFRFRMFIMENNLWYRNSGGIMRTFLEN